MDKLKVKDKNGKDTGDLEIPSLLHYDFEAYTNLKALQKSLENKGGKVSADLKNLNFRDKKIEALKVRCNEMVEMIEDAKRKAEAFYELAGWKEGTRII